jgi:pimeloyl-ACP methyl ester carboxylesterase
MSANRASADCQVADQIHYLSVAAYQWWPNGAASRNRSNQMKRKSLSRALPIFAALMSVVVAALLTLSSFASAQSGPAQGPFGSGHQRPTIVLVHGAWADSSSWDELIPILQNEGYTVDAPPNPLRGLTSDSAYLASYLKNISGPIVLVGHSYGGAVITNAATGNPNVKALVYVDAFAPSAGETLEQLTFAKPGSCLAGGGNLSNVFNFGVDPSQPAGDSDLYLKIPAGTDYAGFDSCFATDVPTQEADLLGVIQRPLALGAFTTPSGTPAWTSIPSWAVIGTDDQAIPPAELTFMAQRAHSHITYVKAGHLSMVTQPWTVASVITQAAFATS